MEKEFYYAKYECLNCHNFRVFKIKFGEPIPLMKDLNGINLPMKNVIDAPFCQFCGCKVWSHGKYTK